MRTNIKSLGFKSSDGETTISAVVYYPDDVPIKAALQVVHGAGDNIGYYHEFMLSMASDGYAVFGHDQLGHGKTAKSPEQYGYFARENGHLCLVRDCHRLTAIAKNMFPQQRLFLLGHSMGSMVARLYTLKYSEELAGAIYLGPPGPHWLSGLGQSLAERAIKRKGEFSRPKSLDKMSFGSFEKSFVPMRTSRDWLSRDEAHVDRVANDPARSFILTASGFRDLFALTEISNSSRWAKSYDRALPTLILSGDCDPVTNFGRGAMHLYNQLLSAGAQDVSLEIYPGARHELLCEQNREEVFGDIKDWIATRL